MSACALRGGVVVGCIQVLWASAAGRDERRSVEIETRVVGGSVNADAVVLTVLPKIPSLNGMVSHTGVIAAVDKNL